MMPMANKTSSAKVGEKLLSISTGVVNTRRNNEKKAINEITFDDFNFPLIAISYWKKIDEDISYEFYLFGVRRISNLYRNGALYLENFGLLYCNYF